MISLVRVAERARDGEAELRRGSADAQVAGRGDAGSASGAGALDGREGRNPDILERVEDPVHLRFVVDGLLRRLEGPELRDVGAGHEGLVARAPQDQHPDALVGVHLRAELPEPRVHPEGHRVARFRPVEGQPGDAAFDLEEDLVHVGHAGSPITPAPWRARISSRL